MIYIRLDGGREVHVDAFDYTRTYAGLLEGRPTERLNDIIIRGALVEREESWGKRKTHLLPPMLDTRDPAHPVLPPALLRVWLTCNDPIDPEYHGSELVVIWFAADIRSQPIAEIIRQAIHALPWDDLADDFLY